MTLVEPGEGGSPGGATNPEPAALPPSVGEHGRQRHGWGSPLDSKLRERRGRGRGGGSTRCDGDCGGASAASADSSSTKSHRRSTVTRAESTLDGARMRSERSERLYLERLFHRQLSTGQALSRHGRDRASEASERASFPQGLRTTGGRGEAAGGRLEHTPTPPDYPHARIGGALRSHR